MAFHSTSSNTTPWLLIPATRALHKSFCAPARVALGFPVLMNSTQTSPVVEREQAALPTASVPPAPRARRLPELLAPAADWDCARAAVENGADAIYFGLEKFHARMRAHN